MKNLRHYIMESVHPYEYTIKLAGEHDPSKLEMFCHNLKKFDPIELGEPKTTPIQSRPYGFPDLTNEPVTIIKAKFRYPATEPMVQQLAQLCGMNVNQVRMVGSAHHDSMEAEIEEYENQADHSPILDHDEMGQEESAKEASKAYGNSYLDSIKDQTKDEKIDMQYSTKKTPDAFDPFKPETWAKSEGKDSPMSKITRPAKPQTGAHKG